MTISDLVDFKGILQQKFDSVYFQGSNLVIGYKKHITKCKINGQISDIRVNLEEQVTSLFSDDGTGNISELKNLQVIDFERQRQIKCYIDDLVFALYFNVKIPEIGFSNREDVYKACAKHKYYKLIHK